MAKVTVDSEVLKKVAADIQSTTPILEGVAALNTKLASTVPKAVDAMISMGTLDKSQRDTAIKSFAKDASLLANEICKLVEAHAIIGKKADETPTAALTADEKFMNAMLS